MIVPKCYVEILIKILWIKVNKQFVLTASYTRRIELKWNRAYNIDKSQTYAIVFIDNLLIKSIRKLSFQHIIKKAKFHTHPHKKTQVNILNKHSIIYKTHLFELKTI